MSAIAQILHDRGESVTGSDREENDAVRRLRAAGVKVTIGHGAQNIDSAQVVVYSAAVQNDNPELVEARNRGIETIERPEMLGRIMEPYKQRVAISGTHGKTTTTSMLSVILDRAGRDATTLIGGDVKLLGGNARLGSGQTIITEACEAFASFLHLHPSITAITNIDADHLDFYGTIERVEDSFRQFVSQVDTDGCVIACADDPRVRKVLKGCGRRVIWFGLKDSPDVLGCNLDVSKPHPTFTLTHNGQALGSIQLQVPGKHNVMNALAAAAVAFELGVGYEAIHNGLADFQGAGRRFEILFEDDGIIVVDDYAHHPVELKATLTSAKSYGKRVLAIFQPHLYSRTQIFADDFADALAQADEVIVSAIYAAREKPIEGVSAQMIVDKVKAKGFGNIRYIADKATIAAEVVSGLKEGDMVMVIGAGDIREVGDELALMLRERGASS